MTRRLRVGIIGSTKVLRLSGQPSDDARAEGREETLMTSAGRTF